LLDPGCYPIVALRLLLGCEDHDVSAWSHTEPDHVVDTLGAAWVTGRNGNRVLLEWGFGVSYRNEIEIWGSNGTLRVERAFSKPDTLTTSIEFRPRTGEPRTVSVPACNQFVRMFETFADCVDGGRVDALDQATLE